MNKINNNVLSLLLFQISLDKRVFSIFNNLFINLNIVTTSPHKITADRINEVVAKKYKYW